MLWMVWSVLRWVYGAVEGLGSIVVCVLCCGGLGSIVVSV